MENSIGVIISIVSVLIIVLLILIYKAQQYKAQQIKNYNSVIKTCIKSIDLFTKESVNLQNITKCLVNEMQDFKNSSVYKDYNKSKQ